MSRLREEALSLKSALEKAMDKDSREEIMDILCAIEKLKVTEGLVNETKLGKTVKNVSMNFATTELAKKAQSILKQWTRTIIAKDSKTKNKTANNRLQKELEKLSETRVKIYNLFVESLSAGDKSIVEEIAFLVEKALDTAFPSVGRDYAPRARTLVINLRKNESLRKAVASGALSAEDLVSKPISELGNEDFLKQRESARLEKFESNRLDWEKANAAEIAISNGCDPDNEWHYEAEAASDDGFD